MQTTLTVTEAAEKLRVCEDTIYTMVRRKQIPHFRVRRRIFFRAESLEAWMKQQEAEIEAIMASNS
ncbi:helix-turn-helix domain-containing protein [Paenibacillus rigui]|uniref:DNA-binding protein n=1 Tax=Paenibacillus rigui TaxID=554312 RepID=A0A229UMI4_9BACL|nr:helix-turn-helix domain-containing protein [Paenibacillus rigui]OXM84582.1 DNA-binding protein [Paenibacillus rigui]